MKHTGCDAIWVFYWTNPRSEPCMTGRYRDVVQPHRPTAHLKLFCSWLWRTTTNDWNQIDKIPGRLKESDTHQSFTWSWSRPQKPLKSRWLISANVFTTYYHQCVNWEAFAACVPRHASLQTQLTHAAHIRCKSVQGDICQFHEERNEQISISWRREPSEMCEVHTF